MSKGAVFIVATACVLVQSASATESTIYPGVGIGKVKLGMTRAQVVRTLGTDYILDHHSRRSVSLGWNFDSWTVTFVANRTVQVGVAIRSQKTPAGIGPGSTWRQLVRAYPHGICSNVIDTHAMRGWNEYLVPHKGGTQTIYIVRSHEAGPFNPAGGGYRVTEVHVRTPFERLPEFGPDWQLHCHANWRTADAP